MKRIENKNGVARDFLLAMAVWVPLIGCAQNPIINDRYSADPSAHVFGEELWVYPSHDKDDAPTFNMEDYHAYSTRDMKNWRDHGVIFSPMRDTRWAKSAAWAPDCVEKGGRYYLYYPTDKRHIGVAVSETPYGPFRDELGHPLISIDSPGVICDRDFIDPCCFIDDDGKAYLFMGQNTVCCIRLNDDMMSYDGKVHIVEGAEGFFEAVWVHKREGKYYMSYSTSPFDGKQPQIAYATSDNPLGPYEYRGVVLDSVNSGTNHHSIVNYKGQDYIFYHRADISRGLNMGYHHGVRRSVCCDSLFYDRDGSIKRVRQTTDENRVAMKGAAAERRSELIAGSIRRTEFGERRFTLGADDTREGLQRLIERCSEMGGGTVVVNEGEHYMDGPIEMMDNVNLHLTEGAVLRFSDDPDAYLPAVLSRWEGTELYNRSAMIHAHGKKNIAITGKGEIDAGGGKMARWGMATDDFEENIHGTHGETPEKRDVERLREMGERLTPVEERVFGKEAKLRPCAIEFNECGTVLIEGITLRNSPFWCIHPLYCEDVIVRDVKIESNFPNNDGCDPESSRRVLIEGCTFRTGDDAIAIKSGRDADGRRVGRPSEHIAIRNCKFYSKCNGLCIGSEMSGGVSDIVMHNIEIGDVKNALLFKSNLDRGGYIENVSIDSISIRSAAGAILRFETNYFGYRGGNMAPRYADFEIRNVRAERADSYAIYYDGNEMEPISNIKVEKFVVEKAKNAHYLFHTRGCRFENCEVNGERLEEELKEEERRMGCDVW